jgi:hypothetical protein
MSGDYTYTFSFSSSSPYDATITEIASVIGNGATAVIPSTTLNSSIGADVDVVAINVNVFAGRSSLRTVTFEHPTTSNFTIIGAFVFNNCPSLETIEFPESLTSIGAFAFANCDSLKTIEFPESLTSIDFKAFDDCSNLTSIIWYNVNNLTNIGSSIFNDSNSINTVTYYNATSTDANVQTLNTMANNGSYSSATKIYAGPYPIPPIPRCFKDGTYILCKTIQNDQERLEQIKVQDLKVGTLVKTKYDGFKPIVKIISSVIKNNPNYKHGTNPYNKDQLYTCSVNKFDDLFEDLVITGSHSILVFPITDKQKEDICGLLGHLYVTDHKYRLPACLDERCVVYPEEGDFTIYHFALEKECKLSNYGVFANGLLVETASICDLEGR